MKILAIDTSCDDTAVAISSDRNIMVNITQTDDEVFNKWGGVVPIIAKRRHEENLPKVFESALEQAGLTIDQIDVIAVTEGPGLSVALEVGVEFAKDLAIKHGKKLVAVNHMKGHLFANFANDSSGNSQANVAPTENIFPKAALLISGGHTEIIKLNSFTEYEKVGRTLDDAIGEAFDKTARYLEWGYPGGPIVERLAKTGDPTKYKLPIPLKHTKDFNFSFSGLKTAVLQLVREIGTEVPISQLVARNSGENPNSVASDYEPTMSTKTTFVVEGQAANDLAASFQDACTQHLTNKIGKFLESEEISELLLGGGVVNNAYIVGAIQKICEKYGTKCIFPTNKKLLTDNAGMIAIAAFYEAQNNYYVSDIASLDRQPRLSI